MFIRLLILIIAGIVVYRVLKSLIGGPSRQQVRSMDRRTPLKAEDEMMQDPQCGVYFARRDAVLLDEGGRTLYFCSEECKEKYLFKLKR